MGYTLAWVAFGGALGASARYLLGLGIMRLVPGTFPWGTFAVNVTGSALFGFLAGLALSRDALGQTGRAFLLVGVLGGFTTFSSFAFETVELLRSGHLVLAGLNVAGQLLLGTLALWAGLLLTR